MKLMKFYQSRNLRIIKGEGQYVWDDKGKVYLDLHTGIGVAFLGHRNKKVIEYIKKQLDEIAVLSTVFETSIREEMLKELDKVKPDGMDNVYLLNSGSEAIELAIKIARKITGRKKFIAFKNSFHGRTIGALSLTWNKKYREQFEPLYSTVEFLNYNDLNELKADRLKDAAAIVVEPIQGEGGIIPAKKEFLKHLREITLETGALLIFDEVQTGFGRTGKVWAYQHYGVVPDILVSAKAIGGGFPVSAVFSPDWISEKLEEGDHGSTYGGNPLAAAAVTAATKVLLEDNVPEQARHKGEIFMKMLNDNLTDLKAVREIRGMGLMIGIDIRFNPSIAIKVSQDLGVLVLKAGITVIRLLPSYLITLKDMEWATNAIREGIRQTENKATSS
jgi:acetylornithine/LysW-gamma-L-lysine aminotransferase